MPIYGYYCECGVTMTVDKPMARATTEEVCLKCAKVMLKDYSGIKISGTRDGFGINNAFVDDDTGKVIDNWNTWEKEGYGSAFEHTKNTKVKAGIKRKLDKITNFDSGKRRTYT